MVGTSDDEEEDDDEDEEPVEVTLAVACAPRIGSCPALTRTHRRASTARKIAVLVTMTLSHDGRRRIRGRAGGVMAMTIGAQPQLSLIAS